MANLVLALSKLFPLDTVSKSQAASLLVCREVIKSNPLPSLEECDQEMEALFG